MPANDFSSPRRMSAGALIILMYGALRELTGLSFVAIGYFLFDIYHSQTFDFAKITTVAGAFFVVAFIIAFPKYFFRKYHIQEDRLVFSHGLASKKTSVIPLSSIHTLRTKRGMPYRILNIRGISFDTLANENQEVELILDENDWQHLLRRVRSGEENKETSENIGHPDDANDNITLKVSNREIIRSILCQNHLKGFAILVTVALTLFGKISELGDNTSSRLLAYLESGIGNYVPATWEILIGILALYLTIALLWTGKVILRYGRMDLRFVSGRLTIHSGILSRYSCRIDRRNATVLAVKCNPLEKIAHCRTIFVRQAENVSGTRNEDNIRIYGPCIDTRFLQWWLGSSTSGTLTPLLSARSGKGLIIRNSLPHLIIAVAATAIMIYSLHIVLPAAIIFSVYMTVMTVRALLAWKHNGIRLYDTCVRIDRGYIASIQEYIRYSDIEAVCLRTTPFTPFSGRVSLRISTNAGATTIFSLTSEKASALRSVILDRL